jgi:hypothetical protein
MDTSSPLEGGCYVAGAVITARVAAIDANESSVTEAERRRIANR